MGSMSEDGDRSDRADRKGVREAARLVRPAPADEPPGDSRKDSGVIVLSDLLAEGKRQDGQEGKPSPGGTASGASTGGAAGGGWPGGAATATSTASSAASSPGGAASGASTPTPTATPTRTSTSPGGTAAKTSPSSTA